MNFKERGQCRKYQPLIYVCLEFLMIYELYIILNFLPFKHKLIVSVMILGFIYLISKSIIKTIYIYKTRCKTA